MAGELQPLDEKFPIVGPDGRPTLYFIKWCQQRQIDITEAITLLGLEEYLDAHPLQEGSGIQITPSGSLKDSPLIDADAQEILDQITTTQGSILYRNGSDWVALAPGTAGEVLQTGGAGANPSWVAGGSGGGTWQLLGGAFTSPGIWDQSVDGTLANIDFTGLAGATDIRIIMDQVTKSVSTSPGFRVSVNNGTSYLSAGTDYAFCDVNGVRTTNSFMGQGHLTNATAARDSIFEIRNANTTRSVGINVTAGVSHRIYTGSTSPINAVRIQGLTACNFTGGRFYCLARL